MKRIVKITYEYDDGTSDSLNIPRVDMPVLPSIPTPWFDSVPAFDYKSCPKCGIALDKVMGYCCQNANCPTGLGPVMC